MRPITHPATRSAALNRCAASLARLGQPKPLYESLDAELGGIIGHKLFTVMVLDHDRGVAERTYTNQPDAYPVHGCKPFGDLKDWGKHVLEGGQPFIGNDRDIIRKHFPDSGVIESLGCGAVINLPILYDGHVLGTLNLLHEEGYYQEADLEVAAPFAQLAIPACRDWAAALTLV